MTNPTNFFGWQMPEPTDLVTDLPADFEVFGQAVDTDFQDLLGGTTGQVLSKTSGTDLDFTWVDPTAGDITGVTAGTGISGGGTSGTVTVTNSMATAIDAKGDLIAGTADDTFSRLAIGANDTVLTADSSEATGLKWAAAAAGGMTLLSTTSLSGTSVTISGISTAYTNLMIQNPYVNTASPFIMRFNGTGGSQNMFIRSTSVSNASESMSSNANLGTVTNAANIGFAVQVMNYADTTHAKPYSFYGNSASGANTTARFGIITQAAALTSLDVTTTGATATWSGGTVLIYGVK
jgi:hypothetical protein